MNYPDNPEARPFQIEGMNNGSTEYVIVEGMRTPMVPGVLARVGLTNGAIIGDDELGERLITVSLEVLSELIEAKMAEVA